MSLTVLKLDEGRYYYTSNGIEKAHYCNVNGCVELVTPKGTVLSPVPDYDHFVELTEKVKELEKDIKTLTNNYKILECEQAGNIAAGQALVDEFGDYEALYEELQRLRKIEKKYDNIKVKGNYPDKISKLKSRIKHLLELQANQDKEVENLRELLKECGNELKLFRMLSLPMASKEALVECDDILTRISSVLGESEE